MSHKLMPKILVPFFPKKFLAITVTGNLSWYRNQEILDRDDVKKHENCHQNQIKKHGWFKFMFLYAYYSWKYGYDDNPFEIECYKIAPINSYKSKRK